MGDNLGPNGLSRGCKVFCSRVDLRDSPVPVAFPRGAAHMALGHYGSERAFAVKPARQRRCPCGLRGLTAQRAQASGYHAKNTEKRSLGPGIVPDGTSGRARLHSASLVILLSTTTTPTRCQESICLVCIKQTVALSDAQIRAAHSFASLARWAALCRAASCHGLSWQLSKRCLRHG